MKIQTKLYLVLALSASMFFSCSDDGTENLEPRQTTEFGGPTVYHERISSEDVPIIEALLTKRLGEKKSKLSLKTHNTVNVNDYEINWDEVNVITDTIGIKNYAFRLETNSPDPLIFYNLIITELEDGELAEPVLAEYVIDYNFYLQWVNDPDKLRDFTGEVYYYDFEGIRLGQDGKTTTLDARTPGQAPCPSVTFSPGSNPSVPMIYCYSYVSYGLCETQIEYGTGTSFHSASSCGSGTGSPIMGYGVSCGAGGTPPDRNTSRSPCGGGGGGTLPGGVPINPVSPGVADIGSFVGMLDNKLQLTTEQENWLEARPEAELILEIHLLLEMEDYGQEARAASRMTIEASRLGLLDGPYNATFFAEMNPYVSPNLTDPNTIAKYAAHFAVQCAILKKEHPQWSDNRVFWEASKQMVHIILDLAGLVPVVGEVCDITNGVIYTIEGDGLNATLSYASAIPVAGWFASGAKAAKRTINLSNNAKTHLKWYLKANDIVIFSDRKQLAKVLGISGTGQHAHHIIPWEFREVAIVQKAAKSKKAFHMNEALNGIPLNSSNHLTGHSSYSSKVNQVLSTLNSGVGNNYDLAYNRLEDFVQYLDNLIENNPSKNLGEIANLINY